MTAKISPSVLPRSHFASVRSDGCESLGAIFPSPFPSAPWQNAQFLVKLALPAAIDAAVAGTGFFNLAASGFPPGAWAPRLTPTMAATASVQAATNEELAENARRMVLPL